MRRGGQDKLAGGLALAWLVVVVVVPLAVLVDAAAPVDLRPIERVAVGRAMARGLGLSVIVATAGCGLALALARTIPPVVILGLMLVSRSILAQGILALGLSPGPLAAVVALILDVAPIAALLLWLRLQTRPLALIEAAADLGAGAWARARAIEWPHLRPAVLAAWVWGLLQSLGDVIAFELAGGGHSYTPGLLIRDALLREQAPGRALVSILILLGLALPCAWLISRELSSAQRSDWRALPRPPRLASLGGWTVLVAMLAVPAALLLGRQPEGFGPADRGLAELAASSLVLSAFVAALASAAGFGLALASRRAAWPGWLGAAVLAPLAIPPSVLGLLTLGAATPLGIRPGPGLTVLALLGPGLGLGFVSARLLTIVIPRGLIDAAMDLGATARERLRLVWLPLGRAALAVSAVVVFAWVLGQAAIPAFTSGPGGDTLAVALTIHARAGSLALVRRWSLILIAAPVLASVLALRLARWRPR
ncbi:spermidine/putrescine ABC transporter membrane protein [Enhygromyxa salina]|uniref:Spermidine/putrescine ABC transporter membrane protein n=1 Tax=Enhygromyxa salina TaxID=215803 RepID=A0A2S9XFT7_9BACT|nr:ABC transporter permease subunit [Enhygromyxa salina]PRP91722.1 spermidine/putrescine ABC transporter membrane protein [Enhygromyxa salina]